MKIRFFTFCLFLAVVALAYGTVTDDDPLKKIISQIQKYQEGYPQEKVHLHMDKPYYAIGDKIWFKAYVVSAENNQPSNISKILYVDLINDEGSIKQTLKLPLIVGLTWGEFALTDSLKEGNYRVRAYTNWMRNFGEDFFFDKTISIGNAITNNIITEINYTFSKDGASQKINAAINYKDIDGNPIANKDVSYDVQLESRAITKGRGKTDSKGNLNLTFINNQPFILKSGSINTYIKLDNNRSVAKNFPVKSTSNDVDVQFFPEGGDLVAGLGSVVAFKALGADGLGVQVSGYLTDNTGTRITEFKSEHLGMGFFRFRPNEGKAYKAMIEFEDGSEKSFDLPGVQPKGFVLSVDNTNAENLVINISASTALVNEEVTVIAQSNNKIYYVSKSKLTGTRLNASIPKTRFPEGILQLTLFSVQNQPVAERLVFINRSEQLKINLSTSAQDFSKREKVKLSLNVTDKDNKPVLGSFSVSVVDETKVPYDENKETTILSNLLLTSDLKGYIQQPNYFFTDIDANKIRHLDILMLTQGWRRFVWKDILADKYPPLAFRPEQDLSISGKLTTSAGKPIANGKLILFYRDDKTFLIDTVTDAQGKFKFSNLHFGDSTKIVLQARYGNDRKNVNIEVDQVPPQWVTKNKNLANVEINVNKSLIKYLKNSMSQFDSLRHKSNILLDVVNIVEKKQVIKNSANLNGAGNADAVITADKLTHCLDLSQCLQQMVTGLVMEDGVPYLTRNMYSSVMLATHMLIVVDGIDVDTDFLSTISPSEVESIEVLKSAGYIGMYGSKASGGVLIITLKRGEDIIKDTYAPGIIKFKPKGYHRVREFYSPDYNDPKIDKTSPDLRTTIYWNPNVVTDSSGKAALEFFNADGTGNYKVIVEGINEAGNIGRRVYRYTVK
jgi:hypothetical protein